MVTLRSNNESINHLCSVDVSLLRYSVPTEKKGERWQLSGGFLSLGGRTLKMMTSPNVRSLDPGIYGCCFFQSWCIYTCIYEITISTDLLI